ncbi:MAG: hypothetical protein HUK15_07840 [Bacteroidales bacterium]|nr:hypothetical protein [Bacteroidales bacterium]
MILSLKPDFVEFELVRDTRSSKQTPMTSNTFTHKELTCGKIMQELPVLLNGTTSFVASSESGFGLGTVNYWIRGIDASHINFTVNGIQFCDAETHSVFWNHYPDFVSSFNNIQITRGVGSSTNGTASFGATVNVQSNLTRPKPYSEISLIGGSFSTFKASLAAGTGVMKNGFSIDLRLSKLLSKGYVEGGDINDNAITLGATWYGKKSMVQANIVYGKLKNGITWWGCPENYIDTNRRYNPAGEYYDANGVRQYYDEEAENRQYILSQFVYSWKIRDNVDLSVSLHYSRDAGYYEEYKKNQLYSVYGLENVTIPVVVTNNGVAVTSEAELQRTSLIRRIFNNIDFYGASISTRCQYKKITNVFGGSGNDYRGQYFGELNWLQYAGSIGKDYEWYRNESNKVLFNFYDKFEYNPIKKLTLYADLQYQMISYRLKGVLPDLHSTGVSGKLDEDLDYSFFNPKGGVNYDITSQMRLYASCAYTHHEPSRQNIINSVYTASKSVDSEKLLDCELGYSYKSKYFDGELALYYMRYFNFIVPTGIFMNRAGSVEALSDNLLAINDVAANVPDAYRTGIELTMKVKPHRRLAVDANMTLSQNKVRNYSCEVQSYDSNVAGERQTTMYYQNVDMPFSPKIIVAGDIKYNVFGLFNLCYSTKYVGKQFIDYTSNARRSLKSYCTNSISLDYTIVTKYVKEIRICLQVNNLFNAKYSSMAYGGFVIEDGKEQSWMMLYPQAGINFMCGVTLAF